MIESIGEGIHYTVFRVGDKVYKIPIEYIRALQRSGDVMSHYTKLGTKRYIDEQTFSDLISAESYDDLLHIIDEIHFVEENDRPLRGVFIEIIRRGENAVYAAHRFAEFGVETTMTPIGILIQEYVEGSKPIGADVFELEGAISQRGIFRTWPVILDLHRDNFIKTPRGYKVFDYSLISKNVFRKNVKTLEDVVNEQSRKTIRNLLRRKGFFD